MSARLGPQYSRLAHTWSLALTGIGSWIVCLGALVGSARSQDETPEGIAFFEQKIRPVLVAHCYTCHSQEAADAKKLKAGLYLDSAEGLLAGGESGPALVRNRSAESLLWKALNYEGLEMPPGGKLPPDVIADFARWIDLGAPDPRRGGQRAKRQIDLEEGRRFWSFGPLQSPQAPSVEGLAENASPIDRFVMARHRELGLRPNAIAAQATLLRRAYFDLIGLPPTPEQLDAFLRDTSPQAFETVIDSLLASEHYGERWARHWLDAARFAESGGYEFDGFRPGAFHYRDWVIRAFNQDLPYDQFVRLQLAGDKLLPDTYEGAAATGFLVAGPYPGQITAKTVERIRYDQLDDMLMTLGGSMLGLTLGCVRCHEHKYDPIPQSDYYGLAAALARSVHGAPSFDPHPDQTEQALARHRAEHEPLVAALRTFAEKELPARFEAWRNSALSSQPDSPRWQIVEPVSVTAQRSWVKLLPQGLIAHDGGLPPGSKIRREGELRMIRNEEEYVLVAQTFQKQVTAIRIDMLADKTLPQRGPGLNGDGSFQLAEVILTAVPMARKPEDQPRIVKLKPVFVAGADKDQPLDHAVDGKPETAWVVRTEAKRDNAAVFEIEGGLAGFESGMELRLELKFRDQGLGRWRIALSTEPAPVTWAGDFAPQHLGEIRAILSAHKNQLPAALAEPMVRWFRPYDAEAARVFQSVLDHAQGTPRPTLTEVYTTVAGGQDVFFLRRGEVDNKQGKAEPGFVQVLSRGSVPSPVQAPSPTQADPRTDLANWITDVDHGAGPLLARVIVNRIWQHHFGRGIVGTPNDFGAQGERPSHPELLEWLAQELIRGGWRLKPLHKQIMLSAVYQQSARVDPENVKLDPTNRWLWHHPPRRLEAEIIRDALLAVGGNLDRTMYGPSVLDNSSRRGVYLRVKRSELIPFMTMFDAPEPTQSVGERISTTVPTQALAMMNSPFVRQQAERLAKRVRPSSETTMAAAIDAAYRIAFSRPPSDAERQGMLEFIDQQQAVLGATAAATDHALVEACQALLCLNEFVYVD